MKKYTSIFRIHPGIIVKKHDAIITVKRPGPFLVLWIVIVMLLQACGGSAGREEPGSTKRKESGSTDRAESGSTNREAPRFEVREVPGGLELRENGTPVFQYQKLPQSPDEEHYYCNFLHPFYNFSGDTLTELFPADHPHHRGIFWAWHQVYLEEASLGDGWFMTGLDQKVDTVWTKLTSNQAELNATVSWYSNSLPEGTPFLTEKVQITINRTTEGRRITDFRISLEALTKGIRIGGSDDEKGYGGFSARIKMPEDLKFSSGSEPVEPQTLQIKAGDRMEFTGSIGGKEEKNSLTIICDKDTPNYPAPWILRQKNSMQNVVWPGRIPVPLEVGKPVVLKYRLVLR